MEKKALVEIGTSLGSEEIRRAMAAFVGKIEQFPPKYSAVKIEGKRAYHLARRDRDFQIPKREVEIFSFELLSFDFPKARFRVRSSAETYVRSLARDLGESLGLFGIVTELRRTEV